MHVSDLTQTTQWITVYCVPILTHLSNLPYLWRKLILAEKHKTIKTQEARLHLKTGGLPECCSSCGFV